MDSIYASPDDFRQLRERNKAKGLHLLEFFVKQCHEIGVKDFFLTHRLIHICLYAPHLYHFPIQPSVNFDGYLYMYVVELVGWVRGLDQER